LDWISTFAFRVRNLVRPLGNSMLGIPCPLMGNGMAIPWHALARIHLASSSIVEDLQMGIDLAVAGYSPAFNCEGLAIGILPASAQTAQAQRRRWEHGRLETIVRQVPRLAVEAGRQRRWDLLGMALDTAVPPLALVVILTSLLGLFALAIGLVAQLWWPTLVTVVSALQLIVAIGIAWLRFARDIPGIALLTVPLYVLRKLPMYAAFVWRRQRQWGRSDGRQPAPQGSSVHESVSRRVSSTSRQWLAPASWLRRSLNGVAARWLGLPGPWPTKSSHRS
jgi:hypothetical protein